MKVELVGRLKVQIEFTEQGEFAGLLEGLTCEHEVADMYGKHNGTTHCLIQGLKELAAEVMVG